MSQLVHWAKEQLGQPAARNEPPASQRHRARFGEPLRLHRLDAPPFQPFDATSTATHVTSRTTPADATDAAGRIAARALQVHNRYLVAETDDGLEVIDQHALHERILYEQLRDKVLAGALESQRLLVPEPVDLAAAEAAAVLEHAELLAQLGVEVEPFGGETVLVSSYPAMLANLAAGRGAPRPGGKAARRRQAARSPRPAWTSCCT